MKNGVAVIRVPAERPRLVHPDAVVINITSAISADRASVLFGLDTPAMVNGDTLEISLAEDERGFKSIAARMVQRLNQ